MRLEIILLLFIVLVVLIDFLFRRFKKKASSSKAGDEKESDQSFKNTNKKSKRSIFLLTMVVVFSIPFSIIGSYLVAKYFDNHKYFIKNFNFGSDFSYFIQGEHFLNSLIFISIYLILFAFFWRKLLLYNLKPLLKYISKRKKNTILSILIILFLKVFIHYFFYPIRYSAKVFKQAKFLDGKPKSVGTHIDVIFDEKIILFIPSIIIVIFVGWYFNDKIKAK
jgi:hypothetical protein